MSATIYLTATVPEAKTLPNNGLHLHIQNQCNEQLYIKKSLVEILNEYRKSKLKSYYSRLTEQIDIKVPIKNVTVKTKENRGLSQQ